MVLIPKSHLASAMVARITVWRKNLVLLAFDTIKRTPWWKCIRSKINANEILKSQGKGFRVKTTTKLTDNNIQIIGSHQMASNGQRFLCPALLFLVFMEGGRAAA